MGTIRIVVAATVIGLAGCSSSQDHETKVAIVNDTDLPVVLVSKEDKNPFDDKDSISHRLWEELNRPERIEPGATADMGSFSCSGKGCTASIRDAIHVSVRDASGRDVGCWDRWPVRHPLTADREAFRVSLLSPRACPS